MRQITELLKNNNRVIVAIDGRCAAGKSTLADTLAEKYDGSVIRMDHFFLPTAMRQVGRINLHYERFEAEVVQNLKKNAPFSYQVFCCKTQTYSDRVAVNNRKLIIVEGAYAMLPQFVPVYNYKIFADVAPGIQKDRIIRRNGEQAYNSFRDIWIPAEEKYFAEYNIPSQCDYIYRIELGR